jgi:hypothetical protein
MRAGIQKITGHLKMEAGWHHDTDGIDLAKELSIIRDGSSAVFLGHALGGFEIAVHYRNQITALKGRIFFSMKLAEVACSYHCTCKCVQ